jgi:hypothetical protein
MQNIIKTVSKTPDRLVAFGCSFTYGDALPDTWPVHELGQTSSKFAWPAVLGKLLEVEVDNRGRSGASNFEILFNILNYDFKSTDVVIIMWSFPDRDMLFNKSHFWQEQQHTSVGAWNDSELEKHWAMAHSSADLAIKSWFYIHHASLFLESQGIKFINVFASYRALRKFKPKFLKVNFFNIEPGIKDFVFPNGVYRDYALDNQHPGVNGHEFIANRIKGFMDANRY